MASFLEIDTKNCKIELACLQMKVNDRYGYPSYIFL